MTRFEDRAPLDFTKASYIKDRLVCCPNCKCGLYVSKTWFGSVCPNCNNYFNKDKALGEDSIEIMAVRNDTEVVSEAHMKLRAEVYDKAEKFKNKTNKLRKQGIRRSHEPDGKPRHF